MKFLTFQFDEENLCPHISLPSHKGHLHLFHSDNLKTEIKNFPMVCSKTNQTQSNSQRRFQAWSLGCRWIHGPHTAFDWWESLHKCEVACAAVWKVPKTSPHSLNSCCLTADRWMSLWKQNLCLVVVLSSLGGWRSQLLLGKILHHLTFY